MPVLKLNPRNVGSLTPRAGRARDTFFDASQASPRGFGVRATAAGSRTYVQTFRVGRRFRWLTLGSVAAIGLSDARELARKALRKVADGLDPQAAKVERRKADTVAAVVDAYVADRDARGDRSRKTVGDYGRQARAIEASPVGKLSSRDVTRGQLREWLSSVAADSPVYANRLHALLRASFRWAAGRELVPADPTSGLERPAAEQPERRRLEDDEIRKLWLALDATDKRGQRVLPVIEAAAVRLLVLLGTRRSETLRMRWADLDLDGKQPAWTIPGEYRKGGRALIVPLSKPAAAVIESLREVMGKREFVLSGPRGGPLNSNPARWATAVREAAGFDFSPHALRRSFARGVARLGTSSELISRLLGHKIAAGTLAVTENYAEYDFLKERAAVLSAWAAHVESIIAGKADKKRAAVVPMARRA